MKKIAFFDFDGTITTRDSFPLFLLFISGRLPFTFKSILAIPTLINLKLKRIDNHTAKEKVLSLFLKGMSERQLNAKCEEFGRLIIPKIVRTGALKKISKHQNENTPVVIVTASPEIYVSKWAHKMGVKTIGTQLLTKNGYLTGNIKGHNCYGPEKVNRIKKVFSDLSSYNEIIAYGDSKGDYEMFTIASSTYYRPFRS